jgi:sugar transferase (PEP-CTERM/EpsH1 system associated)
MRVLFLSQRLPYAPNRGDRLRVYYMLREVSRFAEVDVAALVHDDEEASHAGDLDDLAGEVVTARVRRLRNVVAGATGLLGSTPLTHLLLDSPELVPALAGLVSRRRPDVVLAFCSSMVRFALQPPLAGVPCVLDMIDADSAKWSAVAEASNPPMRWVYRREARVLGAFEAAAMRSVSTTLVVNEKERDALRRVAADTSIVVMENGVDLSSFCPPGAPQDSASVVFCGVMNYGPNVDGAVWLARDVWPVVRAARPDARLTLVGASPSPQVSALASERAGIVVTGSVPDIRPYLWGAAVAAAPLLVARGIQNKVLEAVAAGLPCVVTPEVAEGLPEEIVPACRTGRTAAEFAALVIDLLNRPAAERRRLVADADVSQLQWPARLRLLRPLLEGAARGTRTVPASS